MSSKAALAILLLALAGGAGASAPAAGDASAAPTPAAAGFKHLGYASCAQSTCHGAATPWMISPIRQNEYFQWRDHDPHAHAYAGLSGPRAQAIAAKLGVSEAAKTPLCLGCHSDNVPEAQRGENFRIEEGIGCEACHGGSEKWLGQHNLPDVDPMSMTDRGLYPTWQLQARTTLCLGCHQYGQRGADHHLVAAGHPEFSDDLPAYFAKWPHHFGVDAQYVARKHPATAAQTATQTDLQAAGNWAAALASSEAAHQGLMPELSFFQCDNCHRGLSQPDRGSTGLPRLDQAALRRLLASGALDGQLRARLSDRAAALDGALLHGDRAAFYNAARELAADLQAAQAAAR